MRIEALPDFNALMDRQFEPSRADLAELGIELNVVSNGKHVPEIK